MKITFYLKSISIPDGILSYNTELCKFLKDQGWEVEFLTDDPSCKVESFEGIPVYSLSSYLDAFRFFRLVKYVTNRKPDILVSNIPARNPIIVPLKFLPLKNKPKLITFYHLPPRRWNVFKDIVLSKFDGVIAVSYNVLESLRTFTDRKDIELLRNPFNFTLIKKLAEEDLEPDLENIFCGNKVILYAGRFESQKGVEDLIDIFYIVKKSVKDAYLVLIGNGSKKNVLRKKIESKGLKDCVKFLKPKKNIFKYMKRAKVLAFPSYYESLGRVVVESLFIGTPVVAYASEGDHVDLLSPFNLLVTTGDIRGFAKKVIDVLSGNLAFNFMDVDYSEYEVNKVGDCFIAYCDRLLGRAERISVF